MSFKIANFRTLADAILNDGIIVNGKHLGFDMGVWVSSIENPAHADIRLPIEGAVCGTAACIAGTAHILSIRDKVGSDILAADWSDLVLPDDKKYELDMIYMGSPEYMASMYLGLREPDPFYNGDTMLMTDNDGRLYSSLMFTPASIPTGLSYIEMLALWVVTEHAPRTTKYRTPTLLSAYMHNPNSKFTANLESVPRHVAAKMLTLFADDLEMGVTRPDVRWKDAFLLVAKDFGLIGEDRIEPHTYAADRFLPVPTSEPDASEPEPEPTEEEYEVIELVIEDDELQEDERV